MTCVFEAEKNVRFEEIKLGSCFVFNEKPYMKVLLPGGIDRAVNLKDGMIVSFAFETYVKPMDGECTLKEITEEGWDES